MLTISFWIDMSGIDSICKNSNFPAKKWQKIERFWQIEN